MNQGNTQTELYHQARDWVLEAGKRIKQQMTKPMQVDTKADRNDLVTSVDQQTEDFFATRIRTHYPDHAILGEEGYGDDITSLDGTVWIIDPIDGTMNFVHQQDYFCISVGIYQDGLGEIGFILNVMDDVLYEARRQQGAYKNGRALPELSLSLQLEDAILGLNHFWLCPNRLVDERFMQKLVRTVRGTRTYGSAALEFAYVAEGKVDGYLALGLSGWDVAAGMVIAGEVGAVTTDADGQAVDLLKKGPIFACNPRIQQPVLDTYISPARK